MTTQPETSEQLFYYANGTKIFVRPDTSRYLAQVDVKGAVLPDMNGLPGHISMPILTYMRNGTTPTASAKATVNGRLRKSQSLLSIPVTEECLYEIFGQYLFEAAQKMNKFGVSVLLAVPIQHDFFAEKGLTNRLNVYFHDVLTLHDMTQIAREVGLQIEHPIPCSHNGFVLSRCGPPSYELLRLARNLLDDYPVLIAEPELIA